MKIVFHGATRTVTGSMHEVQLADKRILLDCGFYQGRRSEARERNSKFAFDPRDIDAVFLSHGHTDHCANLPNLVKQGFRGPIWATRATAALTALMLMDSAKIQEEDAAYLNQKTHKSWQGTIEPLYTRADAEQAIRQFRFLEYRTPRDFGGYTVAFRNTGHILGSAAVLVTENANGSPKRLVFTGDVGRPDSPVVADPDPFRDAHVLISECTYGGRRHVPIDQVPDQLATIIYETVQRNGWLLMPAFALGRTQTLIQLIHNLRDDKRIPRWLPIYVDSPLASRLTEVFRDFPELWDEETTELAKPFDFPNLTYIASPDESRTLNKKRGPGIIIASSGMCEGGRILHHLKHHIRYPENTVLLPGYMAAYTLGRKIQDGDREVPILGDWIPLKARVEKLQGLSAHADGDELIHYMRALKDDQPRIFLVHGEMEAAVAHSKALVAAGFAEPGIPSRGDFVEV